MLERYIEDEKVNYCVSVVTPYKIYHYKLYRGYDNVCALKPWKFGNDNTNKSIANKVIVKEHICELVFANQSSLETLRNEYNRNILSKNKN